jgi:hypothetical protein
MSEKKGEPELRQGVYLLGEGAGKSQTDGLICSGTPTKHLGNRIRSTDVPEPAVPLAMLDLHPFVVPGAEAS